MMTADKERAMRALMAAISEAMGKHDPNFLGSALCVAFSDGSSSILHIGDPAVLLVAQISFRLAMEHEPDIKGTTRVSGMVPPPPQAPKRGPAS